MSEDTVERNAEFWRKLEKEALAVAAEMTEPQARRIMLFIAQGYKILSDRVEFLKS